MPNSSARWNSPTTSALRRSALVGMQPQLRQTPPGRSSSTAATESPSCAHRIAATYPPGPVPTTTTSKAWFATDLDEETEGLFEETLHVLEEADPHGAVHDPVVARDGHLHAPPHPELAALGHGLLQHGAHRENGALGRIDDGGKLLDIVHAEIGHGEGRPGELLGAELAPARPLGEVAGFHGDLGERLDVAVAENGRDQSLVEGDRDTDVGAMEDAQVLPLELGVHAG